MKSPQVENGYTRISNELLEAILRAKFQYHELKILMAIIRMTYGWSKKEAQISYGTLSKAIRYDRDNVIHTCKRLERDKVIKISRGGGKFQTNILAINKNYSDWIGREAVDNSKEVLCVDTAEVLCVDTAENSLSAVRTHSRGAVSTHTPLKKPKESIKETERKGQSAVNNKTNKNPKKQSLAALLKGQESAIRELDPRGVVMLLTEAGYELTRAWAAIVQARRKQNPAGYLISILADPKHAIADAAYEQAKLEMRKWNYV